MRKHFDPDMLTVTLSIPATLDMAEALADVGIVGGNEDVARVHVALARAILRDHESRASRAA